MSTGNMKIKTKRIQEFIFPQYFYSSVRSTFSILSIFSSHS